MDIDAIVEAMVSAHGPDVVVELAPCFRAPDLDAALRAIERAQAPDLVAAFFASTSFTRHTSQVGDHLTALATASERTRRWLDESGAPPTDPLWLVAGAVCSDLGAIWWQQGRHDAGIRWTTEALSIRRRLGTDRQGLGDSISNLALFLLQRGRSDAALPLAQEAVEVRRALGTGDLRARDDLAAALHVLELVRAALGQPEAALDAGAEAARLFDEDLGGEGTVGLRMRVREAVYRADRLAEAGHREQACEVRHEAVELLQQLRVAEPGDHDDELGRLLGVHADELAALGVLAQAIRTQVQSLEVLVQSAHSRGEQWSTEVWGAALGLGRLHAAAGQLDHAADATRLAITCARALVQDGTGPPALVAKATTNLATQLFEAGHLEEARAASWEAIDLSRSVAAEDPSEEPNLIGVMLNRCDQAHLAGADGEAVDLARQAVELSRSSAAMETDQRLAVLARALNSLALVLIAIEEPHEAVEAAADSVSAARRLAAADPDHWLPNVAKSLSTYSEALERNGLIEASAEAVTEATQILEAACRREPQLQGDLATCLIGLSRRLSDLGDPAAGLSAAMRCYELVFQPSLGGSPTLDASAMQTMSSLSIELARAGRFEQAIHCAEASLAVARASPAITRLFIDSGRAWGLLSNLGFALAAAGRQREAVMVTNQAAGLLAPLAERNPETLNHQFGRLLHDLSLRCAEVGLRENALDAAERSVTVMSEVAASGSTRHRADLAIVMANLGQRLLELDRPEDALEPARAALALRREVAAEHPAHRANLDFCLDGLGAALDAVGQHAEAREVWRELLELPTGPGPRTRCLTRLLASGEWRELGLPPARIEEIIRDVASQSAAHALGSPRIDDRARLSLDLFGLAGEAAAHLALDQGNVDAAIEVIDQLSAIEFTLVHSQARPEMTQLEASQPALAARLARAVAAGHGDDGGPRLDRRASAGQLDDSPAAVLDAIRTLPGLAGFLRPRRAADIRAALPDQAGIVVVPAAHRGLLISFEARPGGDATPLGARDGDGSRGSVAIEDALLSRAHIVELAERSGAGSISGMVALHDLARDRLARVPAAERAWMVPIGIASAVPWQARHRGRLEIWPALTITRSRARQPYGQRWGLAHANAHDRPRLRFVGDEARAIAALVGTAEPQVESTVDEVLRAFTRSAYVHLACHASAEPDPYDSALLIGEDRITIRDLHQTLEGRSPRFVALSACSTAASRIADEQAVSFPMLLHGLGVDAVLATLWPVSDRGSYDFCVTFYRHWRTGTTVGEAFASALGSIEATGGGSALCPFVLVGDTQLRWPGTETDG